MDLIFDFNKSLEKYEIHQAGNIVILSNAEIDAFIDFIIEIEESLQNKKEQENVTNN